MACAATSFAHAQLEDLKKIKDFNKQHFGLKAGTNSSYASGSKEGFKPGNKTGFVVSAFYAPTARTGKELRSEVVFSRQGYSFDNGGKNTDVLNDYIYLPQLVTFSIGRFFQLQAGGQVGVLLNSKMSGGSNGKDSSMTSFMNRIDYGFAAGVELNPVKGFLIGGRLQSGLGQTVQTVRTKQHPTHTVPIVF